VGHSLGLQIGLPFIRRQRGNPSCCRLACYASEGRRMKAMPWSVTHRRPTQFAAPELLRAVLEMMQCLQSPVCTAHGTVVHNAQRSARLYTKRRNRRDGGRTKCKMWAPYRPPPHVCVSRFGRDNRRASALEVEVEVEARACRSRGRKATAQAGWIVHRHSAVRGGEGRRCVTTDRGRNGGLDIKRVKGERDVRRAIRWR
jgi:hypothetical protein